MANFFSPLLQLVEQNVGENPNGIWGTVLNEGFLDLVDDAIAGRAAIDVSAGNVTLSDDEGVVNQSRNMFLIATGNPGGARDIIVPSRQKLYVVENATSPAQDLTVRTSLGSGVTLTGGARHLLFVDQVADDTVFVKSLGGGVVAGGRFAVAPSIAGSIENATAGFSTPAMTIAGQGIFSSAQPPVSSSTVTVNATTFRWLPNSSPFSPTPVVNSDHPLWIEENGTLIECFVRYRADGTAVEFLKCDGSAWVATSTRAVSTSNVFVHHFPTI